MAGGKESAAKEGRAIVFIDENGLSERLHRCRTWAPRGQTPMLQYHFHWNHLSVIAGVTWWNFYFRLHAGSVNKERIVEFLQHLMRHVPGKLLIVWDRLTAHRSRLVRDFIEAQEGHIQVEWLPAYAPRTQSGGVSLGSAEASRTPELLSPGPLASERRSASATPPHPSAPFPHRRLLETS